MVFGNNWPTKDGTCIRDFIHIMDLVEGHLAAFKYLNEKDIERLSDLSNQVFAMLSKMMK